MTLWKRLQKWGHRITSPQGFDHLAARILPWMMPLAWLILVVALIWGLAFTPIDARQKNVFRIIYIHVPSAALSMSIYLMIATASLIFFIWRIKLCALFCRTAAPYGTLLTALALITGAIWGKPTWGTYWTWDARLTSELILFFIYCAYIALQNSIDDRNQADRISAILAIVGIINIPIIHYSVVWWNSLHQPATLFKIGQPSIAPEMLWPLLLALLANYLLFFVYAIKGIQTQILQARITRHLQ
ncbi:heme ABC transporter permease CcmC [Suttonella ornithocola]|uniref:Heme exporter protein C n=1 Tax=Suttonella ornithocola TaxID=279832 RepID=A0A380MV00_9GAMM|nr:heme ABC transporter permease CcmC [Suttonella ornithocola]SUO96419.1 Cytochrome c-type biogenesis protein CcmC [Suttonella ornithocola]